MLTTEKLYYKDAYQREFIATVLECWEEKGGYRVILDATAFYPEGGGQPYDTGTLGEVRVLEVHEKKGELLHYTDGPLGIGARVEGRIDWKRRFDLMQQHSGEHMVSGLIHEAFGYDNVGFHMGSDVITIDFNGELSQEDLTSVEEKVNGLIWQDKETLISYPSSDELGQMSYRSKKELEGEVRIVEFPDADCCACCGLHVRRAGEIGMIKLLSAEKFRDGVRMEMISGSRVLTYLNMIREQNQKISVLLSAKPDGTAKAVERLASENFRLKGREMAMEERLFAQEAQRLKGKGNVLLFEEGLEADSVRRLAVAVMESCKGRCAVFSKNEDGSYKYAIGEAEGDLRALVKELNQALDGRGGGKPFFVQGSVRAAETEIYSFFQGR